MSSGLTLIVVVLFGVAAICWTLIVLVAWLRHRRLPLATGGLALASTTVVMISLAAAAPDDRGSERLSEDGTPLPAPEYTRPEQPPEYGVLRRLSEGGAPEYSVAEPARAYSATEQARVDGIRREFAPALERFRQTHGRYPNTLLEAGIGTPMTLYGPLHYYGSQSEADPWYLISFGDIERDRFSADWDSRSKAWTLVTLD